MNHRQQLTEAAFWHDRICGDCWATASADESECGACGSENLLDAQTLERFVGLIEAEQDSDE